ncbi:unnamed protein product [Miscanthus lutarioriparius]|uniref:Uncharacterized protein n=1 Tax=Miscanthus lutarioriparius TaxID=422564 RepID=A0A811NDT1_9POAL|nr:unnamed protein product [Miscanthus lutarioriparius]
MRWRVAAAVQICGGVGLRRHESVEARGCEPGYGGAEQRRLRAAAVRNSDGAVALSANRAARSATGSARRSMLSSIATPVEHLINAEAMQFSTNWSSRAAARPSGYAAVAGTGAAELQHVLPGL